MTEFKGTPGPYSTRDNCGSGQTIFATRMVKGVSVPIPIGHTSAVRSPDILHGTDPIEQQEAAANAQLWSTAPDLLAACQSALPSNLCLDNPNIPDSQIIPLDFKMGELRQIAAAIAKATSTQPRSA